MLQVELDLRHQFCGIGLLLLFVFREFTFELHPNRRVEFKEVFLSLVMVVPRLLTLAEPKFLHLVDHVAEHLTDRRLEMVLENQLNPSSLRCVRVKWLDSVFLIELVEYLRERKRSK